jgi:hypothetical protein
VDGRLEPRLLLSHGTIQAAAAHAHNFHVSPTPPIRSIQVANGGRALLITTGTGQQFEVTVSSAQQSAQTATNLQGTIPQLSAGTVRGHALPGGRVALTVDGTTDDSIVAINPVVNTAAKNRAHQFSLKLDAQTGLLNVASINVTSGQVSEIDGYRSADLSGPVTVGNATFVNRIAFADLLPGASIGVGGNLGSLDILNNAFLSGGPGIKTAGDLDWFSIGQNLILTNGSSLIVGRDIGAIAQGQKGTAPFGQGGQVVGDVLIGPGSSWQVVRALGAPINLLGNFFGFSRFTVGTPTGNGFQTKPGAILVP